jgi:hypothetical protein
VQAHLGPVVDHDDPPPEYPGAEGLLIACPLTGWVGLAGSGDADMPVTVLVACRVLGALVSAHQFSVQPAPVPSSGDPPGTHQTGPGVAARQWSACAPPGGPQPGSRFARPGRPEIFPVLVSRGCCRGWPADRGVGKHLGRLGPPGVRAPGVGARSR